MTETIRSIEQLTNEITHLREQNQTLTEELDFHRKIFSRVNQVLGAIGQIGSSRKGDEAIKQLLYENAKLKNELRISRLSEREREVLKLIAQGNTSKKIADLLNISKLTVDTHRKNIQQKLGVSNMVELIKVAMTFDLK